MGEELENAAMRRAFERYEQLCALAPDAVVMLFDAEGRQRAACAGATGVPGVAPEELGQSPQGVGLGGTALPLEAALRTARVVPRTVFGVPVGQPPAADAVRWFSARCEPVLDESGQPVAVVAEMHDVTEELRALQALSEQERRFRLLADHSTDMISLHSPDGSFLYASPGFEKVLGHDPARLLGMDPGEFVHPDDLARMQAPHSSLLSEPDVLVFDYRARHAAGHYVRLETTAHSIRDAAGEVVELQALTRDISARETTGQRFRFAFEEAPIGIVVTGLDGRFVEANRVMSEITGYPRSELLAKSFQEITHPDDIESDLDHSARLRAGEISRYELDKRYVRPDGAPVWIRLTVSLARDPDGRPAYFIGHIQDVDERRAAEVRLAEQALTDPLTGLANRRLLFDRLEQADRRRRRSGGEVGVVFVDLDSFKECNDRYGHEGGDAMLQEVARRLLDVTREEDTVSRYGGDEFVVVCVLADAGQFAPVVERVRSVCRRPFRLGAGEVPIAASVGGVLAAPGEALESVMRRADADMYTDKARRRAERDFEHD